MCTLWVPFVVFPYIWVAPAYAVNVVDTVMVCVNIYVVILTHILELRYPLLISGNTTSVWCLNTRFQCNPKQQGRILLWLKLSGWHVLLLHTLHQNSLPPRKLIRGSICVSIFLVCVCIGNILWDPGVQQVNIFLGAPLVEIHTRPCKSPNKWIHFWLAVTSYIAE